MSFCPKQWRASAGLAALICSCIAPGISAAHELWLAPISYQVAADADLSANIKNGQHFSGISLPYLKRNYHRFERYHNEISVPYMGRNGDFPAFKSKGLDDGLLVVLQETNPVELSYDSWQKFVEFLAEKGHDSLAQLHLDRGLAQTGFSETYSRHVKTLIAVGSGAGQDKSFGLSVEIVAKTNPYDETLSDAAFPKMEFALERRSQPWAGATVTVFEKTPGGQVQTRRIVADAHGHLTLPVRAGHQYLLDAVHLEPTQNDAKAVWRSYWAALTFEVPQ